MSSLPKIKCPHCGAALDAQAKFCGECGAKIVAGSSPEGLVERPAPPSPAPIWQDPPRPTRPPAAVQNVQVHSPTPQPAPHPASQVNVYVNQHGMPQAYYGTQSESASFAIITLVMYFFFWPLAALLNIIGLFTGPKRGCFVAMLFFCLLPIILLIIGLVIAVALGAFDEIVRELDRANQGNPPPF